MTKPSIKTIRKLNPWIKSDAQARKIIKTYHTTPKKSLNLIITEAQRVKQEGRF